MDTRAAGTIDAAGRPLSRPFEVLAGADVVEVELDPPAPAPCSTVEDGMPCRSFGVLVGADVVEVELDPPMPLLAECADTGG